MSDPANRQARRRFLKIAVVGAAVAPIAASLLPRIARADEEHLDPNDATAKALGYTEDAANAKSNPAFKPNSSCSTCNFFKGHSELAYAPCDLFPGKAVSSKGWCASWTAKAGPDGRRPATWGRAPGARSRRRELSLRAPRMQSGPNLGI